MKTENIADAFESDLWDLLRKYQGMSLSRQAMVGAMAMANELIKTQYVQKYLRILDDKHADAETEAPHE